MDNTDAMIFSTDCARKTLKWYIRSSFFHLLNLAMLTAHIIHITKSRKKCKLEKNVVEGIRQPLSEHTAERPAPGRHSPSGDPTRLTGRHFKMTLDAPLQSKKKTSAKSLLRV